MKKPHIFFLLTAIILGLTTNAIALSYSMDDHDVLLNTSVDELFMFDNSRVDVINSGVGDAHLYDSSTLNLYPASWGASGDLHNSSTLNIYGGNHYIGNPGGGFDAYDSSITNMYGGNLLLTTYDTSLLNLYGGYLDQFPRFYGNSTINIYGGSIFEGQIYDNTHLTMFGQDSLMMLTAYDDSIIDIYGYGFEWIFNKYSIPDRLTGFWANGSNLDLLLDWVTPISGETYTHINLYDIHASNPTNPVPEPSTIFLLGSGLFGLVAWGRKNLI